MLRIAAISAFVGLISYYIDVKKKEKGKTVSGARAMRNAFITLVVLTALYYLKVYMSGEIPHAQALEKVVPEVMIPEVVIPEVVIPETPVPVQPISVPDLPVIKSDVSPALADDAGMLQLMKSALNMARKPKTFKN